MTTKALERQVGRVFSPRAHCGLIRDLANSKIFGRDIAVWVFAPDRTPSDPAAGGARDSS